jgi:hypothetical protein
MTGDPEHDAIRALVLAQFATLDWTAERDADWAGFITLFAPGAPLFDSKRPVRAQTAEAFVERMRSLRDRGLLVAFSESLRGMRIHRFGNVAVALAACDMLENSTETTHDVSAFLLVREAQGWRIAAQAWDTSEGPPLELTDEVSVVECLEPADASGSRRL